MSLFNAFALRVNELAAVVGYVTIVSSLVYAGLHVIGYLRKK